MAKHAKSRHSKENKNVTDNSKTNIVKDDKLSQYVDNKVKEKHKKKITIKIIVFIIFLAIFLFSAINLGRWIFYNKKSSDLIENIVNENFTENNNEAGNAEFVKNPVDFEALKDINSDIVAWIRIKDTSINYPIVQTTDNDYYLHKDINKNYNTCGWIFMDYKNTESFIDKNTVLYGHNIKSGLMFADLEKILNQKLGTEITIEIYTPTEKLNYRVFSCYMEEPEDYATKSNIVEESDQEKYIKEMLKRTSIKYNVIPDKSDRVLTLSTCDKTGKNRILVHSVYMNGEKY